MKTRPEWIEFNYRKCSWIVRLPSTFPSKVRAPPKRSIAILPALKRSRPATRRYRKSTLCSRPTRISSPMIVRSVRCGISRSEMYNFYRINSYFSSRYFLCDFSQISQRMLRKRQEKSAHFLSLSRNDIKIFLRSTTKLQMHLRNVMAKPAFNRLSARVQFVEHLLIIYCVICSYSFRLHVVKLVSFLPADNDDFPVICWCCHCCSTQSRVSKYSRINQRVCNHQEFLHNWTGFNKRDLLFRSLAKQKAENSKWMWNRRDWMTNWTMKWESKRL